MTYTRHQQGFTLLELMITVSIMSLLLTLSAPSFTRMIEDNYVETATDDLINALAYARNLALGEGDAILCPSTNNESCNIANGTANAWSNNWIILDAGGEVAASYTIRNVVITVTSNLTSINFDYLGTTGGNSSFNVFGSNDDNLKGSNVSLMASGLASYQAKTRSASN